MIYDHLLTSIIPQSTEILAESFRNPLLTDDFIMIKQYNIRLHNICLTATYVMSYLCYVIATLAYFTYNILKNDSIFF